jgi:hypothetical protein
MDQWYTHHHEKGANMSTAMRLIFITFVGFLRCSSVMLTDSLRAQELEGLEAAQNNQPAPTNLSPEESRKHSSIAPVDLPRNFVWAGS